MAIQELIALALVALAAAYWLRGLVRTGRGSKGGCTSGCGKCSAPTPTTQGKRIGLPLV